MTWRRTLTWIALAVLALVTVGCANEAAVESELRDALTRTSVRSHRFTYVRASDGVALQVEGAVEDDLRRRAAISLGGRTVFEEVVADDALVVKVVDPAGLALVADDPGTGSAQDGADPTAAAQTRALLLSGVWVEDQIGAPSFLTREGDDDASDPINEALGVFDDVRAALRDAAGVVEHDVDDPRLRADPDPFPAPATDVVRYDVLRPGLPGAGAVGSSGVRVAPDLAHFRRMSVDVRDGLVVAVHERIDVASRVDELIDRYELAAPHDPAERLAAVLAAINTARRTAGETPIGESSRQLVVHDVGSDVRIDVPSDTTVASLLLLRNRGSVSGARPAESNADQSSGDS